MLCLRLHAPFAACRTFTAGWYRPTAGFLTPSAAYGLILNIARIESRLREEEDAHGGRVPASLTRSDLPSCRIAIGIPDGSAEPRVQSVFQQLHNYPVGRDAGTAPELAMGSKNNISPVRRELLVNMTALVCVDSNTALEARVRDGLAGRLNDGRYGLPFVGDNQFLLDRLEAVDPLPGARWYERVEEAGASRHGTTRLTIHIDRADMSRTVSALYALGDASIDGVPRLAWTSIPPDHPREAS